jgi:hypothetical protein
LQKQIDMGKDPISVTCRSDFKVVKVEDFMKERGYYLRKQRERTNTHTTYSDRSLNHNRRSRSSTYIGNSVTSSDTQIILVFSKNKE